MRIILNYHPAYFRELYTTPDYNYIKNKEGSNLLAFIALTGALGLVSLFLNVIIGMALLSLVLTVFQVIKFLVNGIKVFKNHRKLDAYLAEMSLVEYFELIVEEKEVKLIEDNKKTVFEWSMFDTFRLTDQYVFLANTEINGYSLFIPARTMEPNEYDRLWIIANENRDLNAIDNSAY